MRNLISFLLCTRSHQKFDDLGSLRVSVLRVINNNLVRLKVNIFLHLYRYDDKPTEAFWHFIAVIYLIYYFVNNILHTSR